MCIYRVLFDGERKRRNKVTHCDVCERMICRNEYYRAKVILVQQDGVRYVEVRRTCKGC
jgi:hypothetical protein